MITISTHTQIFVQTCKNVLLYVQTLYTCAQTSDAIDFYEAYKISMNDMCILLQIKQEGYEKHSVTTKSLDIHLFVPHLYVRQDNVTVW